MRRQTTDSSNSSAKQQNLVKTIGITKSRSEGRADARRIYETRSPAETNTHGVADPRKTRVVVGKKSRSFMAIKSSRSRSLQHSRSTEPPIQEEEDTYTYHVQSYERNGTPPETPPTSNNQYDDQRTDVDNQNSLGFLQKLDRAILTLGKYVGEGVLSAGDAFTPQKKSESTTTAQSSAMFNNTGEKTNVNRTVSFKE